MSQLFRVDFENGLLYDPERGFDILSVSGGTLAVTAGSKYEGTYGLEATPLYQYRAGGAKIIHNPSTGKFRQAFYFHPNGITIPTGGYLQIGRNNHYDASQQIYTILLTWTGSSYAIQTGIADNTLAPVTWSADLTMTNAWHLIETYWQRGTPGSFQIWIDGTSRSTITATNNLCWVTTPGIGCNLRAVNSVSTTGKVYFDRWIANDDGSLIGA